MSYLFQHSAVGTLLRYCFKGNIDFTRERGKRLSAFSWTSHAPSLTGVENGQVDLVDWSGPDDPSNPLNWPLWHKFVITTVLSFYTFAVYVGSSIYTSSQQDVIEIFGVSHVEGALGVALYVLGYGLGCLLFSPLSEIPVIGRNPPYAISGFLFVTLCVPTALVNNYPGLMILRFLLGFMCSPCLATAAATFADIWLPAQFPFAVALWVAMASLGPACGPTISSYAVAQLGWRFSAWELLIISGFGYLLLACCLPETSGPTILHYRAMRMREETGNVNLKSESELKQESLAISSVLWEALVKPWEMNVKDPALLFTTVYSGLVYGVFYSFFESLPLVYPVFYDFSATSTGLVFLAALPGALIACAIHCLYLKIRAIPRLLNGSFGELENHLVPGLLAGPAIPIGLFLYAWTSRPSVHWIAPTIGLALVILGMYFTMQSIFLYIPMIYPRYAASIFAANSMARSLLAFTAILVARPMFNGLGIDRGVTLLGGLTFGCTLGMAALFKFGKKLRERSSFAVV